MMTCLKRIFTGFGIFAPIVTILWYFNIIEIRSGFFSVLIAQWISLIVGLSIMYKEHTEMRVWNKFK